MNQLRNAADVFLVLFCLPIIAQKKVIRLYWLSPATIDALKHLQAETAAKLAALLPAILDRAFKRAL